MQAQGAQEAIGLQGALAQDLGQAAGRHAALELQLPEPVLGMCVAQGEAGVGIGGGVDVGHAVRVADELDRRCQARYHGLTGMARQAQAQP